MALTERIEQDKIEIVGPYRAIQVRNATVIERDGVEVSRSFNRVAYMPDQDISGDSAEVQAIANSVWTQDVKDAYAAFKAAQASALQGA